MEKKYNNNNYIKKDFTQRPIYYSEVGSEVRVISVHNMRNSNIEELKKFKEE